MDPTLARRDFLKTCGASLLAGLVGCSPDRRGPLSLGAASAAAASTAAPSLPPALATLPAAGAGTPASLLVGAAAPQDLQLRTISGALPADLGGHYLVVGAQPRGGGVFAFNGEGVVRRVDLATGRFTARAVVTPCAVADEALAGTRDAFRDIQGGPARFSARLGLRTQPNTALQPLGPDRLLVTTDAGRPFELDPLTLETATAVGWRREWRPGLDLPGFARALANDDVFPMLLTTAHPAHDAHTGETFGVNYGGTVRAFGHPLLGPEFTDLIRWDGQGALERWSLVDARGRPIRIEQSIHQMGVTSRYVLLADTAFRIEPEKFLNPAALRPQLPSGRVFLVRRGDLAATRSGGAVEARAVDLPREVAHFVVDYDDPQGRITLHAVHNTATDGSEWLLAGDRRFDGGGPVSRDHLGFISAPTDLGHLGRHVIDGGGARLVSSDLLADDALTWGHTLSTHGATTVGAHGAIFHTWTGFDPALLPERVARAYARYPQRVRPLAALPRFRAGSLLRYDARAGRVADAFVFPRGWIPGSPEHVPMGAGYVVCVVLSDDRSDPASSGDELWVFAAGDLAQGPLCRLGHPALRLPFTLHTTWLPEVRARAAAYRVDPVLDHASDVDALEPALRDVFLRQVYPRL
ncbi:MAG: carotenoid oxygenase family protein [Planctomycetota bacterium]